MLFKSAFDILRATGAVEAVVALGGCSKLRITDFCKLLSQIPAPQLIKRRLDLT
jgi:hypothetical protein